jgi:hypothetical protein
MALTMGTMGIEDATRKSITNVLHTFSPAVTA